MVYNLVITPKANLQIEQAILWYNDINPELTVDFVSSLDATIQVILAKPLLFQKVSRMYRKTNLVRFPYKVVYAVEDKSLIIAAVTHHKRSNKHWISRK